MRRPAGRQPTPDGDVVTDGASRSGTTLVEATLDTRAQADESRFEQQVGHSVYRKTIPAAEKGAGPVVDRLVVAEISDMTTNRALQGPGTVEFHPSAADPLDVFTPAGEPTGYLVEEMGYALRRTEDAVLHRFEESREVRPTR